MKILYITYGLPCPPDSGARVRDFNLISRVCRHHRVWVLSLLEFPRERASMPVLAQCCEQVDGVLAERGVLASVGVATRGLLRARPLATATVYYPQLARRIHSLSQQQDFDLVQIEHSVMAPYRAALATSFTGACVLSLHNIAVQQYRSMLDISTGLARVPAALKWLAMRGWEGREAGRFQHCIVVSEPDRLRLRELGAGDHITTIANGVDCARLRPLPAPMSDGAELLFVGTLGYRPNRDAVEWFCRYVLPRVRAVRPDCCLRVVGSGGREHLAHLTQPGVVEVSGRVDDPVPFYQRAQVVLVPLRSGGGSRLKILEAMALGRPVVSTTLGCAGLDVVAGSELLVADDPGGFAGRVLELLADPHLRQRIARAARGKVERHYDWDLQADRLLELYQRLAGDGSQGGKAAWEETADRAGSPRLAVVIPVYNAAASLGRCLDALGRSSLRDFELIIVDDGSSDRSADIARARCRQFIQMQRNCGPAAARNAGSRQARAELLFFLDADVLVQPDTLQRVLQVFDREPGIAATFCAYQPDTPARNFCSQYKNLLHHYTHQVSAREAASFCGGYGAIRRAVFLSVGGFDPALRAMEDVELGYRLHQAGHRILLSADIQLTHTKKYTLAGLVRSDVQQRAIPWTRIMLARRIFRSDLNLRAGNLASMMVLGLMPVVPFLPLPVVLVEITLLLMMIVFNGRFLLFLRRKRGGLFALTAVPMLWLQYFYSGVGLLLGILAYLKDWWTAHRSGSAGGAK